MVFAPHNEVWALLRVVADGLPLSAALFVADDVPLAVICLEHPGKRSRSSKIPPVFDE